MKKILLITTFMVCYLSTFAASREIKGLVKADDDNSPLIGASVFVSPEDLEKAKHPNSSVGVLTAIDGSFIINVPEGIDRIFCTYIGYKQKEIKLGTAQFYNISMEPESQLLEDVVVTGYQRIERRKVTSSIATIDAKEIQQIGVASIDQLLEGQLAGVVSTPLTGSPGAPNRIRIRGTASLSGTVDPLWVVDGIPLEQDDIPLDFTSKDNIDNLTNSSIAGLNPDDIESINVLKDAAATAIYGARAANGVIVITTKKGKKGKMKISVNAATFINTKPDFSRLNLMNSSEKVDFELQLLGNSNLNYRRDKGGVSRILQKYDLLDSYAGDFNGLPSDAKNEINSLRLKGDNWGDLIYKTAVNQQYGLSLSGGSDKVNYYFSAGYFKEDGTTRGTGYDRFNLTLNTDYKITDKITFGIKAFGTQSKRSSYITETDATTNPSHYSRTVNPYQTVYDENQKYVYDEDIRGYEDYYTPFNYKEESENTNYELKTTSFKSLFSLNYNIIRGLNVETQFGMQLDKSGTEKFAGKETYFSRKYKQGTRYNDNGETKYFLPDGGIIQNWNDDFFQYNWRTQGQYQKTFAEKHDFDVMLGFEMRSNKRTNIHTKGFGFDEKAMTTQPIVFPETSTQKNDEKYRQYKKSFVENAFLSYYATLSYTYDNRYTFFGSVRFDGSNLFGVDPKYRYLPLWSASAAWNINREHFLRDQEWLSNLKLRFSYGLQGNIDKSTSPFVIGEWNNSTLLPGTNEPVINVTSPPNQKLRWEKTANYNGAIDFGALDNRINFTIEGYYRDGRDLIGIRALPQENGFDYSTMNWARVTNKGIEFSLSTVNIRNKNFQWRTDFNISRNISKVNRVNINENSFLPSQEGYPVNGLFAIKTAGIDENGLPMFWKDGEKISFREFFDLRQSIFGDTESGLSYKGYRDLFTYVGDQDPKFTGGFINKFNYKNFDLAISCTFNIKETVRETPFYTPNEMDPGINYSKNVSQIWSSENMNGKYPSLLGSNEQNEDRKMAYEFMKSIDPIKSFRYLDLWVKQISYLRVSSIRLGYSLPNKVLEKTFLSSARFNFEARNPFVFGSNYNGYFDPETYGNIYAQPIQRSFSVGVNLSF